MSILSGDIKLVASQVMDDVPEGGGAPTPTLIADGVSNAIFPDISELSRAGGNISLRKLFVSVQTANRDTYMGANVIVAEPPNDPNVSMTVFSPRAVFDRRTDAANLVESYLVRGVTWPGFLYENHVSGQRTIAIFQKPNTTLPTIGRTLVLVQNEGLVSEQIQYVRATTVEQVEQDFYDGASTTYKGWVVTVGISDALRANFSGTPANRQFTAGSGKTIVRDTTAADAGSYFGVQPLAIAASIGDSSAKAASVYTQLVPSARTESVALDQLPAAQRTLTLATTPREVTVAAVPHSTSIKVGQENRSYSWVNILKPRPAPNAVVVSFMALGQWYTLADDGAGALTGSGTGTINYTTGSISVTLPALPDVGTSIIFSWGENVGYTSHAGEATFRNPEFSFVLDHQGIKPGSVTVTWLSAGVTKTVTDNSAGAFSNASATGEVNYAAGKVHIRPLAMIDSGGQFQIAYQYATTVTRNLTGLTPDAGGFVTIPLDDVPAQGSVHLQWITVRNVSASSGATAGEMAAGTNVKNQVTVYPPPAPTPTPPVAVQGLPIFYASPDVTEARAGSNATLTLAVSAGWGIGTGATDVAATSALTYTLPSGLTFVETGTVAGASGVPTYSNTSTTLTITSGYTIPASGFTIQRSITSATAAAYSISAPAATVSTSAGASLAGHAYTLTFTSGALPAPTPTPQPSPLECDLIVSGVSGMDVGGETNLEIRINNNNATSATLLSDFTVTHSAGFTFGPRVSGMSALDYTLTPASVVIPSGHVFAAGFATIVLTLRAVSVGYQTVNAALGALVTAEGASRFASAVSLPITKGSAPLPPAGASREPVSTGMARDPSGSYFMKGRYLGGVTLAGAPVYVAVSISVHPTYGNYFDPPASSTEVWQTVDLTAKQKVLQSAGGITTTYLIWEAAT